MMNAKFKKRFVVLHLLFSFFIAVILIALILFKWFPYPLIILDGTWQALLLLLGIDLVLGPLLAWLVISNKKKKIPQLIDLSIIVCLQVLALCYGIFNISSQRVVALVFFEQHFHLVSYELAKTDTFKNNKLKYYKGIAYGMIAQNQFTSQVLVDIERTLYNPSLYQALDNKILSQPGSNKINLSNESLKRYQGKSAYKIAGKQTNGAVILDENYNILEIILEEI